MDEIARQASIAQNDYILKADLVAAGRGVDVATLTDGVDIAGGVDAFRALVELRSSMLAAEGDKKSALRKEFKVATLAAATSALEQ